jgi:putative transposase
MHINYRPASSLNHLVKKLKGRSFRKLQQEFLN